MQSERALEKKLEEASAEAEAIRARLTKAEAALQVSSAFSACSNAWFLRGFCALFPRKTIIKGPDTTVAATANEDFLNTASLLVRLVIESVFRLSIFCIVSGLPNEKISLDACLLSSVQLFGRKVSRLSPHISH